MTEQQIIQAALYDLMDSIGALTNPNELNEGLYGQGSPDIELALKAREILLKIGRGA